MFPAILTRKLKFDAPAARFAKAQLKAIDPEKPIETSDVIAALFMVIAKLENGGNNLDPKLERFKTPYGKGLPPVFWENIPAEEQGKLAKDHLHPPERIIQRMNEDLAEESPLAEMIGEEIEEAPHDDK